MKCSGKINIGCIIMSIVLAIVGVAAYRIIPLRIKAAEMKEEVKHVAEQCATNDRFSTEMAVAEIKQKAKELELPITEKQIRIERNAQVVRVQITYDVAVDIIGYKYALKFDASYDAPRFD